MKNLIKLLFALLLIGTISSNQVFAKDKEFSGIIIYNITYPDSDLDPQMQSMMPKTLKMFVKGNFMRTEINMGMGSNAVIYDAENNSGISLFDVMGQKFAIELSSEDIENELAANNNVEVEFTDETKEIAGYECKKAIVKIKDKNGEDVTEHYVYFTDELGSGKFNFSSAMFKDINGQLMEYVTSESEITMVLSAVSVEKKKISDDKFLMSEDYKIITKSEMESMFGGY